MHCKEIGYIKEDFISKYGIFYNKRKEQIRNLAARKKQLQIRVSWIFRKVMLHYQLSFNEYIGFSH